MLYVKLKIAIYQEIEQVNLFNGILTLIKLFNKRNLIKEYSQFKIKKIKSEIKEIFI